MASSPFIIVAIHGGSASGNSSMSRTLNSRFYFFHVYTGSFYSAITAEMMSRGVTAVDVPAVRTALAAMKLGTRIEGRSAQMEIDGRVAGDEIRSGEVNEQVSHFAAIADVRT